MLPLSDLHVHARAYHSSPGKRRDDMTVDAVVRQCEARGLRAVGILDHFGTRPGCDTGAIRRIVEAVHARGASGPALLAGAEADILDERGHVTLTAVDKEELGLDYCLAAVHGAITLDHGAEAAMARYHSFLMGAVCHCDAVDGLAHPWYEPRHWFPDWCFVRIPAAWLDELIGALAEHNKVLEVSRRHTTSMADPAFRAFLVRARENGVRVFMGSDAHELRDAGEVGPVAEFLADLGFTADDLWTVPTRP